MTSQATCLCGTDELRAYRISELQFLAGTDHPERLARRLGWSTWHACEQWLRRQDEHQLVRTIAHGWKIEQRERKAK
ncbi:hypothetical protein [Trueperella pyogenes]|uniref:hypothetical protein n=1 Tax=Trueperella pyogenes TaxID=1661 RepID=UPI00345D91DA